MTWWPVLKGGALIQETNLSFSPGKKSWAGTVSVVEYLRACLPGVGAMSSSVKKKEKGGAEGHQGKESRFPSIGVLCQWMVLGKKS